MTCGLTIPAGQTVAVLHPQLGTGMQCRELRCMSERTGKSLAPVAGIRRDSLIAIHARNNTPLQTIDRRMAFSELGRDRAAHVLGALSRIHHTREDSRRQSSEGTASTRAVMAAQPPGDTGKQIPRPATHQGSATGTGGQTGQFGREPAGRSA